MRFTRERDDQYIRSDHACQGYRADECARPIGAGLNSTDLGIKIGIIRVIAVLIDEDREITLCHCFGHKCRDQPTIQQEGLLQIQGLVRRPCSLRQARLASRTARLVVRSEP